jgi:hypothetical protein
METDMSNLKFKSGALAAVLGLGLLAAPAYAESNYYDGDVIIESGGVVRDRDYHPDWRGDEDWHHERRYNRSGVVIEFGTPGVRAYSTRRNRSCSVDRALDKAEDLGLHRVRVVSAGERTIKVRGRKDGERVTIRFGRERGCPIYAVY